MLIFRHTKINEDEDEPEEDWNTGRSKLKNLTVTFNAGDMSDGDVERRIRARRI